MACQKRILMAFNNVGSNVKSNGKTTDGYAHYHKAQEVYLLKIFRVEKQIGDTKKFS